MTHRDSTAGDNAGSIVFDVLAYVQTRDPPPPLPPTAPPPPYYPRRNLWELAANCQAHYVAGVTVDGLPHQEAAPFAVQCQFRDGQGWIALEAGKLERLLLQPTTGQTMQTGIIAGSYGNSNPY